MKGTIKRLGVRAQSMETERWSRVDNCCWIIGYTVTTYWIVVLAATSLASTSPSDSPGWRLRRQGLTAVHPVVMVPGIIRHPLELWEGEPCANGLFRKHLSLAHLLTRPRCCLHHLALCNRTGLDPPGIRVRAVSGLSSPDFSHLVDNLSKIGYEGKSMHVAAYDWRLAFHNTEMRDQALSRLKSQIELMKATNGGRKVVVVAYSMGALYFLHFIKWVEAEGGGPGWCKAHIKALVNIAPAFLGDPSFVVRALDSIKAFQHLLKVVQTWDSIMSLMPKGGDSVWGNIRNEQCKEIWTETSREFLNFLRWVAPELIQRADAHFSYGIAGDLDDPKYSHHKYWSNPLETRLPEVPEMEIFCLYGVGMPVVSAGLMCSKGWRGKTRFNPSGAPTYVREYLRKSRRMLLNGRSGGNVNIMNDVDLIEDIIRVAAGASGSEIGGDRIYSRLLQMSERINFRL